MTDAVFTQGNEDFNRQLKTCRVLERVPDPWSQVHCQGLCPLHCVLQLYRARQATLKEHYVAMVLGVNNTHGTFVKRLFCTFVLFCFFFSIFSY